MKIRLKLTLLFAGLFAALLLVFSLVIYFSNASQREEEYFKRLRQLAITKTNLLLEAKVQPAVLQVIYENSLNTLPRKKWLSLTRPLTCCTTTRGRSIR
ncbi:hypothetical protein ACQ86N_24070 [Puia sp. P3]|uniref:hypothetical protein n=1 Tax=Puia sp. P3 TaxID=3423952 RepID=UPI003D675AD5